MTELKKIKIFSSRIVAKIIQKAHLYSFFKFSDDNRPNASFKLVFFCGAKGIEYLNASLFSVYHSWKFLPEIFIVSDGTPLDIIKQKMVNWPRNVSIISWEDCAEYYKNKGNNDLYIYASKELWGKKLTAVLYCAEHFPTLYSDTDILWYSSPKEEETLGKPFFKMAQDVEVCYSKKMLEFLDEEDCLLNSPLNAGVIYASGDFSVFYKWKNLCAYFPSNADNRSEQTAFAILNNHFNRQNFWNDTEILITGIDTYDLKYTRKFFPNVIARHYAGIKTITFWRDFVYMWFEKYSNKTNKVLSIQNR